MDFLKLTRKLYNIAGILTNHNTPTNWTTRLGRFSLIVSILAYNLYSFFNGCRLAGLTKDCISQTIVFLVVHVQSSLKFGILVTQRGKNMKHILDSVEGYVFLNNSFSKKMYIAGFYTIFFTVLAYAVYPLIKRSLPFFYETTWGSETFLAFSTTYLMVFFDLYLNTFITMLNDFTYLLCADALCVRLNNIKLALESIDGTEDEEKLINAIIEHQTILR